MPQNRYPAAAWRPVRNFSAGVNRPPRGAVLHTAEGSYEGTISWQNNPASEVSSYFVVAKDGRVAQCVDLADKAWTQSAGNSSWIGIECEGFGSKGESLSVGQIASVGALLAWLHLEHGIPLQETDDPVNGRGLITHGAGGTAWGGHFGCPGNAIKAQRALIISNAKTRLGLALPLPPTQPALSSTAVEGKRLAHIIGSGSYLRKGSQGAAVHDWQVALLIGCGQKIATDGSFGDATANATKNLQRFFHLGVDGIVGPSTRKVMAYVLTIKFP